MSVKKFNQMSAKRQYKTKQQSLVLFAIILVGTILHQQLPLVSCEPDQASTSGSSVDQVGGGQGSSFGGNPKRQYLIAPRIGRSANGNPAIWSALEEAALTLPGQVQAQRGYPSPLRSSLLFLVGNRRMIGPRSGGGLLPQARIGRRSAPIGLMPQPRVGRRSSMSPQDQLVESQADLMNANEGGGALDSSDNQQQEVAMATLSDSSPVNDILDSLISG